MDVRYLANAAEETEYLKISAASFIWKFDPAVDDHSEYPVMGAFDNGRLVAGAEVVPFQANYCGNFINTVVTSGICSQPELRRMGGVRAIFNKIQEIAEEKDWTIGMLHPFSISYYEKFGYANLGRMFAIRVPFSNLTHIPRCTDVTLYSDEHFEELSELHEKCALHENLMTLHNDKRFFCEKPIENSDYTYFHRDKNGVADGYVRFTVSRPDKLTVNDLFCLTPDALYSLIGFLRNYDGIVKNLVVCNQYPGSPFACLTDRVTDAFYEYSGGAAGRIYDLKKLLEVNSYPQEYGHFRLLSRDTMPCNSGIFEIEYQNGKACVTRKNSGDYDIALTTPAAARLMLAGEGHCAQSAMFIDGTEINGDAKGFFNAFPRRPTRFIENF